MFWRSISLFICTLVAVAIATGYSGQHSNTGSGSEVAVHHLRNNNLESSTSKAVQEVRTNTAVHLEAKSSNLHSSNVRQSGMVSSSAPGESGSSPYHATQSHIEYSGQKTPTTAAPATVAQTITHTDDDHISLLQSLSQEEKNDRLMEAARAGAVEEVEALLAAKADVGARDKGMKTALHWAAARGHAKAARRLLAAGADVNARDVARLTPLHWAALWGHTEAAVTLLEAGADKGAKDRWGNTPRDVVEMLGSSRRRR